MYYYMIAKNTKDQWCHLIGEARWTQVRKQVSPRLDPNMLVWKSLYKYSSDSCNLDYFQINVHVVLHSLMTKKAACSRLLLLKNEIKSLLRMPSMKHNEPHSPQSHLFLSTTTFGTFATINLWSSFILAKISCMLWSSFMLARIACMIEHRS